MTLRTKLLAACGLAAILVGLALFWNHTQGSSGGDALADTSSQSMDLAAPSGDTSPSNPQATPAPDQKPAGKAASKVWGATDGVEQLLWEDLMPAGEEERLTALYEDFYRDFEKSLLGNQTQLSDLGRTRNPDPATIAEGSDLDVMPQIGTFNTVADLNNVKVRIPAYVVPLEFNAKKSYREFLLVPYYGACLHTPPPPPNQIIYVKSESAVTIKDIWQPVWAQGTLTTDRHENGVGNAAYTMLLAKLEPYES